MNFDDDGACPHCGMEQCVCGPAGVMAAPVPSNWQPIETAPKDGSMIDLWVCEGPTERRLADCYWCSFDDEGSGEWRQRYAEAPGSSFGIRDRKPTHWAHISKGPQ